MDSDDLKGAIDDARREADLLAKDLADRERARESLEHDLSRTLLQRDRTLQQAADVRRQSVALRTRLSCLEQALADLRAASARISRQQLHHLAAMSIPK
ncbi:Uncharacterized protein PBTT_04658 [Plasmodiophora brassicae]